MGIKIYDPAWRKELAEWMNFPHTVAMSEAMRLYAAQNRHKPKTREHKMCQACGAVSIVGGDRLRESNKNAHGAFYCDRECAESDRGRVYRTSEAYQEKCHKRFQREGKKRNWEKRVCKIYDRQCKICHNRFMGKCVDAVLCSKQCKKMDSRIAAWITHRKSQAPIETHCAECGVWFTTLVRTQSERHYCSGECSYRYNKRQAKHTRRERYGVPRGTNRGLVSLKAQYKKHKGTCQICGCNVIMSDSHTENRATVDHMIPLSKGGLHVESNVQLACWKCNTEKADELTSDRQLLLY